MDRGEDRRRRSTRRAVCSRRSLRPEHAHNPYVGAFQPPLSELEDLDVSCSLSASTQSGDGRGAPEAPEPEGGGAGAASELRSNPYVGSHRHAPRSSGFQELLWEAVDDQVVDRLQARRQQTLMAQRLTTEELAALATRVRGPEEPSTDACAVCLEPLRPGDELRRLPCGHEFHKPCADRWLRGLHSQPLCQSNSCCPVCKAPARAPAPEASLSQLRTDGTIPAFAFENLGATLLS